MKARLDGQIIFDEEGLSIRVDNERREYVERAVAGLDGLLSVDLGEVTVQFKDWWFNCRPSNTEPLLRLNVEAKEHGLLEDRLKEIQDYLGEPVGH
jgi:phosphomannomutase